MCTCPHPYSYKQLVLRNKLTNLVVFLHMFIDFNIISICDFLFIIVPLFSFLFLHPSFPGSQTLAKGRLWKLRAAVSATANHLNSNSVPPAWRCVRAGPREGGKMTGPSANITLLWRHSLFMWLLCFPFFSSLSSYVLFPSCLTNVVPPRRLLPQWPGRQTAFYQFGACQKQALCADKVEPISCLWGVGRKISHCVGVQTKFDREISWKWVAR